MTSAHDTRTNIRSIRDVIPQIIRISCVILMVGLVPGMAHAHTGFEPYVRYVMLFGLFAGLITGAVCAIWHFSVRNSLLPSFGIYLALLIIGGFLFMIFEDGLPSKTLWSTDFWSVAPILLVLGILMGGLGCIPLALGAVAMSFVLNGVIAITNKLRGKS
jgi:hypothetical protein